MDNSSYVSLSLSSVMRRSMDITTHNIANANTAGFKGERAVFEEYLHKQPGKRDDVSFSLDKGSYMDLTQGGLVQTGSPLDVAIQGSGWMAYETAEGRTTFGRDGKMVIDQLGNLSTTSGALVLDAGGTPIAIPPASGSISISEDGQISDANGEPIATIGVFEVDDIQAYERLGNGMFGAPEGAGEPAFTQSLDTKVMQGFVEQSNVQPIVEITRMMEVQRAYDRSIKLSEGGHELTRNMLSKLGRA
jgi:flagellar basal-body rod protein FlgF